MYRSRDDPWRCFTIETRADGKLDIWFWPGDGAVKVLRGVAPCPGIKAAIARDYDLWLASADDINT